MWSRGVRGRLRSCQSSRLARVRVWGMLVLWKRVQWVKVGGLLWMWGRVCFACGKGIFRTPSEGTHQTRLAVYLSAKHLKSCEKTQKSVRSARLLQHSRQYIHYLHAKGATRSKTTNLSVRHPRQNRRASLAPLQRRQFRVYRFRVGDDYRLL